jgi:D-alanine-D-alanine ligase
VEREAPALAAKLSELAQACWALFGLTGYARVDFRVDRTGAPQILEVNVNPCLSPDAGFAAAAEVAGLSYTDMIGRIVEISVGGLKATA